MKTICEYKNPESPIRENLEYDHDAEIEELTKEVHQNRKMIDLSAVLLILVFLLVTFLKF